MSVLDRWAQERAEARRQNEAARIAALIGQIDQAQNHVTDGSIGYSRTDPAPEGALMLENSGVDLDTDELRGLLREVYDHDAKNNELHERIRVKLGIPK
jgi:hypothetical protein